MYICGGTKTERNEIHNQISGVAILYMLGYYRTNCFIREIRGQLYDVWRRSNCLYQENAKENYTGSV